MLFLKVFVFVLGSHFSKLLLNRDAFRVPTCSSGNVLFTVPRAKKKSWKVTFCLDRRPYIEVRDGLGWRFMCIFSTPGFRETLRMEGSHTGFFKDFWLAGRPVWRSFCSMFCSLEKQDPQAGRNGFRIREIAKPFSNCYL